MMHHFKPANRRTFLKHSALLSGAAYLAPLGSLGCAARADRELPDDDWVELFNGTDLAGWHRNPEPIWHGTGGSWEVQDGVIVGAQDPPGSGNGGILLTDEAYGDFDLSVDLKPSWGIDSGLFVRATDAGAGFQVMVDYLHGGSVGFIYGEQLGGFGARPFSLAGETDDAGSLVALTTRPVSQYAEGALAYAGSGEEWLSAWRVDDWNTLLVRVEGAYPTITTWINGTKIMSFDAATFEHERYDREEVAGTLGEAGSIALQVHGGADRWPAQATARWKNIRIRPL